MGNCQAIDNASLVIQHPNGKAERLYSDISAAEVMKLNPGHYVALLLTTTLYSSRTSSNPNSNSNSNKLNRHGTVAVTANANVQPLRITRIKLLRHTENLTVGHIYRLITTQEVMKGLMAKKNGNISNNIRKLKSSEEVAGKHETAATRSQPERIQHQIKRADKERRRTGGPANSSAGSVRPKGWHPSLNSISEASS